MGRYINYDEFMVRYPLAKTWSDKASHVNSHIIYAAENEIDSLLAPSYSTPFSASHPTVKDLSMDYSKYLILLDQDPKKAATIHGLIMARIKRLNSGEQLIMTDSGYIEPSAGGLEVWSSTKDYHPTHSMLDAHLTETHVDSSMLEDMESERL